MNSVADGVLSWIGPYSAEGENPALSFTARSIGAAENHDWAGRVVRTLLAHGSEEKAGEAAAAA